MAAGHLVGEAIEDVGHRELSGLAGDLAVEHDLEQQVAELLDEVVDVVLVDGVQHLVGFLDQVRFEGGAGLLAVPRAATLAAQPGHQGEEGIEAGGGGDGHGRSRG